MQFTWDPAKAASNQQKHSVSFAEAVTVFLDPLALTFADPKHSDNEDREITIGHSDRSRLLFLSHCLRADGIRIISARRATPKERAQHEKISLR